jgi:hypothetical protein
MVAGLVRRSNGQPARLEVVRDREGKEGAQVSDDRPSIAELRRQINPSGDLTQQSVLMRADVGVALLKIAAAALELNRTDGVFSPASAKLADALGKVRP